MSSNKMATKSDLQEMYSRILPYLGGSADAGFTPVGTVISVMSNHAPANYLICNGTVYNIADYPELANHFLNEFGSKNKFGGNGTTTFAVPDLRGEFLRGTGTNGHSSEGSGANVGVHQNGTSIPNIAPWSSTTSNYVIQGFTNANGESYGIENSDGSIRGVTAHRSVFNTSSRDTNGSGQGLSLKIRPTNTSVLFCIAVKDIYYTEGGKGGVDYSNDEQDTGLKWLDGKKIYQRTFTLTNLTMPSSNTQQIINLLNTTAHEYDLVDGHGLVIADGQYGGRQIIPTTSLKQSDGTLYWNCEIRQKSASSNPLQPIFVMMANATGGDIGNITIHVTIQYTKVNE